MTQEYVDRQKSTAQIAKEIGCVRSTVVEYLLKHGVELRQDGLPHYRKSQLAYGERIHDGRVVPHLGEQKVIAKLNELRVQGYSYAKLAHWANKEGIPTKNRAGRWDRRTIYEILRRSKSATP